MDNNNEIMIEISLDNDKKSLLETTYESLRIPDKDLKKEYEKSRCCTIL